MAVLALTDAYILLNSNNISDHCKKCEIPLSVDDLDVTAFGGTWKSRIGGLKDGTLGLTIMNDFAAANIDSIMFPLLGQVVPFEIRPTSAARSATNPAFTGSVLIKEWKPITGSVGDLLTVDVSFPTSGPVLRPVA